MEFNSSDIQKYYFYVALSPSPLLWLYCIYSCYKQYIFIMTVLPSVVVYSTQYGLATIHPLCAVIGKYSTHILSFYTLKVQQWHHISILYDCFLNQLRNGGKTCIYIVLYN